MRLCSKVEGCPSRRVCDAAAECLRLPTDRRRCLEQRGPAYLCELDDGHEGPHRICLTWNTDDHGDEDFAQLFRCTAETEVEGVRRRCQLARDHLVAGVSYHYLRLGGNTHQWLGAVG